MSMPTVALFSLRTNVEKVTMNFAGTLHYHQLTHDMTTFWAKL